MHQTQNIFVYFAIVKLAIIGIWICIGQLIKIQNVSNVISLLKIVLLNKYILIDFNLIGQKKSILFPVIKQENYIPDKLHLLLRISDVLMECFFNDLFKKKEFERQIKNQIEQAMKSIKVHFEFFKPKSYGSK